MNFLKSNLILPKDTEKDSYNPGPKTWFGSKLMSGRIRGSCLIVNVFILVDFTRHDDKSIT